MTRIEYKNTLGPKCVPQTSTRSFDLLGLELDGLSVDEDTLALVRLWPSPFPDLGRELRHLPLIDTLQQNTSRLGSAGLDALRDPELDGVGEADLERHELLARIRWAHGCRVGFDGGSVSDTDETEHTNVALGNTGDVILEQRAGSTCSQETLEWALTGTQRWKIRTPHSPLARLLGIQNRKRGLLGHRVMVDIQERRNLEDHLAYP